MNKIEISNFLKMDFGNIPTHIFSTKIENILPATYVAVRGQTDEEGAVQRVLSKRRIASIMNFVIEGNMFYTPFILNWTNNDHIKISKTKIEYDLIDKSAQVIDGQHRLEGIKQALKTNPEIKEKEILIILAQNLSTEEAAKIFLNINTEQKPVPQSLVYDLFSAVKDKKSFEVRINDLARKLNTEQDSPYYQMIKMPGLGIGKVDFSILVSSLKPYMSVDSTFSKYNLDTLEIQYKVLFNFYNFLRNEYEKEGVWNSTRNPFMTNAGIYSSIEFLCKDVIPYCASQKSFENETIKSIINLESQGLLLKEDIKNLQGKEQRSEIYKYLSKTMQRDLPKANEYKF